MADKKKPQQKPEENKTEQLVATRVHKILDRRATQLNLNISVKSGGRPYINQRLHRAPNESERSWNGSAEDGIVGRKERAFMVNDAGRIPQKINDFLFAESGTREGIDEEWSRDVTASGLSIRQFWHEGSSLLTCCQWFWIQVDRGAPTIDPESGQIAAKSVKQKEDSGDRVYWSIWNSTEVVDWCFGPDGNLLWLITEQNKYDNSDPFVEAVTRTIRTLWRGGTYAQYDVTDGKSVPLASGAISANVVPFVCVGVPSTEPWWFDDVEALQCAMLNLESLNYENLVQTVYAQLVVPASMAENLVSDLAEKYKDGEVAKEFVRELIRGLEYPFTETPDDKDITRYLTPSSADLKIIPDNKQRLRKEMFEMGGLALFTKESRQIQSADSKEWDHLDVNATLKNRALMLQDSERKAVALSKLIDTSFKEYDPIWPQEFNVKDTSSDVDNLVKLANVMEMPDEFKREFMRAVVHKLDEISHIKPEIMQAILDEIKTFDFSELDLTTINGNDD